MQDLNESVHVFKLLNFASNFLCCLQVSNRSENYDNVKKKR